MLMLWWESCLHMKSYFFNRHLVLIIFVLFSFYKFKSPIKKIIQLEKNKTILISSIIIDLSIKLKNKSQKLGQLECEISKDQVSKSGGWCAKISGPDSTQHLTDINLAETLSTNLKNKCVASFGDGPGIYKKLLIQYNQVLCYDAFDGAPFFELTTNNTVNYVNLSQPIYHLRQYGWIISLEVAEHIPK